LKEAKNRKKLGQDLSKEKPEGGGSQLGDIVLAMKKLEEEVIAYRQGKRDKVKLFLDTYDELGESGQKNGIVDISELTSQEAREGLADDLVKEDKEKGGGSQLGDIVLAMKELEEEVIAYRQGSSKKEVEDKSNELKSVEIYAEENQEDNSQKGSSHFDDRSSAPLNDWGWGYNEENNILNINILQDDDDYELEELSNQEQLETQIEMPPYGTPGTSKK